MQTDVVCLVAHSRRPDVHEGNIVYLLTAHTLTGGLQMENKSYHCRVLRQKTAQLAHLYEA